jgi:hypothetical protein
MGRQDALYDPSAASARLGRCGIALSCLTDIIAPSFIVSTINSDDSDDFAVGRIVLTHNEPVLGVL